MAKSDDAKWHEPIALACADSFLRAAQSFIDPVKIQRDIPEGPVGAFGPAFGDLAVCATNLGFALELYLKCLRAQLGLPVPRGHDLWALYKDLPPHIKTEIEDRYESGRTTPSPTYASITFSLSRSPVTPSWQNFDQLSMKLEDVLERSKDVFVSWRYVFELRKSRDEAPHQLHTFEYLLLLFGCVAINAVILRNWYTPLSGTDPDGPRLWMVLNSSDFTKVSSNDPWVTVTITDQYTGKRYQIRNLDGNHFAEALDS